MENKIAVIPEKSFVEKWKIQSENLKKINTIPDVFKNSTPVLSIIKRDYGPDFLRSFLSNWISDINFFCGGQMNVEQCEVSADLIYEDFYFLTVADLKLISKRLRKKKFIRISGNEIYTEIEFYFNERCKYAQKYSNHQSEIHKSEVEVLKMNDEVLEKYYKDVKNGCKISSSRPSIEKTSDKLKSDQKKLVEYYKKYRKDNPLKKN